jgi:predicted LPLAT superfamily acyltransferase
VKDFFYRILISLTRFTGTWLFRVTAWFIASGYFFFSPRRVRDSFSFYKALFPNRSSLYLLSCTWRQFHRFTHVFLDRLFPHGEKLPTIARRDTHHLTEAIKKKQGGILLMSHLGHWELAAHLLFKIYKDDHPDIKLLLYLGRKHQEQIESRQKEDIAARGIEMIAITENEAAPLDLVKGIQFLRTGGLVSMTGDRRWRDDQRSLSVKFLHHKVRIPEAPFVLALLSGAPIFIFFTHRTGPYQYDLHVFPPLYVRAPHRKDRQEILQSAAQLYADRLEEMVRQAPFEWFHFEPFLEKEEET